MKSNVMRNVSVILLLSLVIGGCQRASVEKRGIENLKTVNVSTISIGPNESISIHENPRVQDWEKIKNELSLYSYKYKYLKKSKTLFVELVRTRPDVRGKGYHFLPAAQMAYLLQNKVLDDIRQNKILSEKVLNLKFAIEVDLHPGNWELKITSDVQTIGYPFEMWLTWSKIRTSGSLV